MKIHLQVVTKPKEPVYLGLVVNPARSSTAHALDLNGHLRARRGGNCVGVSVGRSRWLRHPSVRAFTGRSTAAPVCIRAAGEATGVGVLVQREKWQISGSEKGGGRTRCGDAPGTRLSSGAGGRSPVPRARARRAH